MPRIDETAYRQLKATPTDRELRELYTPTLDERLLAQEHTTGKSALVAFLALLKTFQHLGYAVALTSAPCRSFRISPTNWGARSRVRI